jgi:hypothetical protein
MQLTHNFNLDEFTVSAGLTITPSDEQIFCIDKLCRNILQKVRDKFGSIKVTSGLRNEESYKKLVEQGYPASKTSDHFAWSTINPIGTGAADIVIPGEDTLKVFHWMIDTLYSRCGQIIYYEDNNFIHVSNNFNEIFMKPETRPETRNVMTSRNGRFFPYARRPKKAEKSITWRLLNG